VFKPCCLPTSIGSLPHKNAADAIEVIEKNLEEIPIWPQLPNLSFYEIMYVQVSEGMPLMEVDTSNEKIFFNTKKDVVEEIEKFYEKYLSGDVEFFKISKDYAAGFYLFLNELKRNKWPKVKFVKGHLVGPVSFGLSVSDDKKQPVIYNETLMDTVLKTLSLKAKWQEDQFKKIKPDIDTIIFFDEPSLQMIGSAYVSVEKEKVIAYLNECFSNLDSLKGVHCCGNTDWSILMETNADIISFDAYDHTESFALYPKELKKFINRGGVLAWGIVPAAFPDADQITSENLASILKRFEEKLELIVVLGIDKQTLLEQALITPNCGTGSMSEELAEKSFALTRQVSEALRKLYF
jgi:methionine synthase II (cobalamin-independent)